MDAFKPYTLIRIMDWIHEYQAMWILGMALLTMLLMHYFHAFNLTALRHLLEATGSMG